MYVRPLLPSSLSRGSIFSLSSLFLPTLPAANKSDLMHWIQTLSAVHLVAVKGNKNWRISLYFVMEQGVITSLNCLLHCTSTQILLYSSGDPKSPLLNCNELLELGVVFEVETDWLLSSRLALIWVSPGNPLGILWTIWLVKLWVTDRWTLPPLTAELLVADLGSDKNFLSEHSFISRCSFRSCSKVFKDSNIVKSPRKKISDRTVEENRKKRID